MVTIDVDDVRVSSARWQLQISPAQSVLRQLGKEWRGEETERLEAAASNLRLVDTSAPIGREDVHFFSEESVVHPFVEAIHMAYDRHLPLELGPDDVWLCIAQGFGLHVNENAEALRHKFVRHQGKVVIKVQRDEFVRGASDNDWNGVFAEFSDQIAAHIGKQRDLVVANFSTTGAVERAASQVVLMSAMQKYFEYRMMTMCGIPRITLLGTTEDWKSVRTRAAVLGEYDLGFWVDALLPVLDEFVAASQGKINRDFWRSIYKLEHESGGPYISGWMPVFFPYIVDEGDSTMVSISNKGWMRAYKKDPYDARMTTDCFPRSLSVAPFIWEYLGAEIPMEFLAGFMAVSQHPETGALRPAIGWAIREAPPSSP